MITKCIHLNDLLEAERPAIVNEIKKTKWYLSEKARHDVGWKTAEKEFIDNYLKTWAAGYKSCYCGQVCKDRYDCKYAQPYLK
jgi:hypothetical protein